MGDCPLELAWRTCSVVACLLQSICIDFQVVFAIMHSRTCHQQPGARPLHGCRSRIQRGRAVEAVQTPSQTQQGMAVVTKDLHLSFGSGQDARPVLKGVDLQIPRGSLHMLLGPNGCGKSTLLKVLGGLVPAGRGQVHTDSPTGFVFQNPDHQVVMPTVAADVAFGLGRYVLPESQVRQVVASALDLVNMKDFMKRATHTLSGGQRQRVAIAGALAENPRLLLLDELTTFLDVEDQFGVLEAVRNVTRRGCVTSVAAEKAMASSADSSRDESPGVGDGRQADNSSQSGGVTQAQEGEPVTAIWVTHRFEELQYADSASYMQDGKVVFTGSGPDMLNHLKRLGAPV